MIDVVHVGSAVLAVIVTGLMTAGFVRLAWRARGLIGHFAKGVVIIHFCALVRTAYRDLVPLVLPETSPLLSVEVWTGVVVTLNLLVAVAGWHGLLALYLAIPEPARRRYSILTAALYPPLFRR